MLVSIDSGVENVIATMYDKFKIKAMVAKIVFQFEVKKLKIENTDVSTNQSDSNVWTTSSIPI